MAEKYATNDILKQVLAALGGDGATGIDDLNTAIGAPADAAWDGVAASASVIALLKKIAVNTEPA